MNNPQYFPNRSGWQPELQVATSWLRVGNLKPTWRVKPKAQITNSSVGVLFHRDAKDLRFFSVTTQRANRHYSESGTSASLPLARRSSFSENSPPIIYSVSVLWYPRCPAVTVCKAPAAILKVQETSSWSQTASESTWHFKFSRDPEASGWRLRPSSGTWKWSFGYLKSWSWILAGSLRELSESDSNSARSPSLSESASLTECQWVRLGKGQPRLNTLASSQ